MTSSPVPPGVEEPDAPEDDLVPVSVRLGEVVPPEDPENWRRPLTWVAAAGMLAGPMTALAWFAVAPPATSSRLVAGTFLLAAAVAGGAALTGSTQRGAARAWTATLAAALFSGLVVVIVGGALAEGREVGQASPTLAHAFGAAIAGVAGAVAASPLAARLAGARSWWPRLVAVAAVAVGVAVLLLPWLFPDP